MTVHNEYKKFRDGEVTLTYRETFIDCGKHYASLFADDRLIAADVLLGDAQAIVACFNNGRNRMHHYGDLAARVRAAQKKDSV